MEKKIIPTKVITGVCRWSYANVWQPKAIEEGAKPKYSVSLIIPKSDTATIEKIKAAIQAAYEEGTGKLKGTSKSVPPLSTLKTPLRDGDTERPDDPAYANSYLLPAWSMQTVSRSSTPPRYTAVFTVVQASISTHMRPKRQKASPAA